MLPIKQVPTENPQAGSRVISGLGRRIRDLVATDRAFVLGTVTTGGRTRSEGRGHQGDETDLLECDHNS